MYNDPDNVGVQRGRNMSTSLPNALTEQDTALFTRKIAQGSITQARQEGPLVDLQLKRHKTGENGEYVSQESQLDSAAVSGIFPSHYYREISVCETCFLVRAADSVCYPSNHRICHAMLCHLMHDLILVFFQIKAVPVASV